MFANRRLTIPPLASIRTRLLIAFMLIVLIPISTIGIVLGISTSQGNQVQLRGQFQVIADSKEAQISDWLASANTASEALLAGQQERTWAEAILQTEKSSPKFEEAIEGLGAYLQGALVRSGMREILILSPQGEVLYSTNATHIGQNHADQPYFANGMNGPYTGPLTFDPATNQRSLTISKPIRSAAGQILGVLGYHPGIDLLDNILYRQSSPGTTEKSYLISPSGQLLTVSRIGSVGKLLDDALIQDVLDNIASKPMGMALGKDALGATSNGFYRQLDAIGAILIVEQTAEETDAAAYAALAVNLSVGISALLIAIFAALLVTRSLAVPVADLAETAAKISRGDFQVAEHVERDDEIGALAQAFNSMTAQLKQTMDGLEQQVAERTMDLELRSAYLQASAEVSQVIASILDPNELIREVVELIRERFNLYYVGLFLVNERGDWAILKAGTGQAGVTMLARGHRIAVGKGMIGWSIANAAPRIALQAGADTVRLATPELPETRAEAALPLRARERVLGAISIQSVVPEAFNKDNIAVFQIMADQVAVALENARLYSESQAALESTRRSFGEASQAAWAELFGARPDIGYRSDEFGAITPDSQWRPEMLDAIAGQSVLKSEASAARQSLAIPIKVRDNVIGALYTYKTGEYATWDNEETALLQTIGEQIGVALESAQLFQDTRQRASREQLIGQITARIRETLSLETVLQTAVAEIGRSLGLQELTIHLETDSYQTSEGNKEFAEP